MQLRSRAILEFQEELLTIEGALARCRDAIEALRCDSSRPMTLAEVVMLIKSESDQVQKIAHRWQGTFVTPDP